MRSRLLTAFLFVVQASACFSQTAQLQWDTQLDRPVDHNIIIYRGETLDLLPRLVQGTDPVTITNTYLYFNYREQALVASNMYRQVACTTNGTPGTLKFTWTPGYDVGADYYDYAFVVGPSTGNNPRVHGRITMKGTVGYPTGTTAPAPSTHYVTDLELSAAVADKATTAQVNQVENLIQDTSNTLASAMQSTSNSLAGAIATSTAAIAGKVDITGGISTNLSAYASYLYGDSNFHGDALFEHDVYIAGVLDLWETPVSAVATGTGNNGTLPTKGYVDDAVAVNAAAISALNSATGALHEAVGSISTQLVERLWSASSTTNYMDGDGIFYRIVTYTNDWICVSVADDDISHWLGRVWTQSGPDTWVNSRGTLSYFIPWEFEDETDGYKTYYDWTAAEDAVTLTLTYNSDPSTSFTLRRGYSATSIVDRTVNTNGTIIIIGSSSDASGTITNLQASAGASTVNLPFLGQSYFEAEIAGKLDSTAIPAGGCTDLDTSTLLTGATTAYYSEPTSVYTLNVTNTAPRYTYSLRVEATNSYSLASGLYQDSAITPTGTNIFVFVPGTGSIWRVYGRAL